MGKICVSPESACNLFNDIHFAIDHPELVPIVIKQMRRPVRVSRSEIDALLFRITPAMRREAAKLCRERHDDLLRD